MMSAESISTKVAATQTYTSVIVTPPMVRGVTVAHVPRISRMFAMFEPSTLPSANDVLPLNIDTRLDASSGIEVPPATRVMAMVASDTPHSRAIAEALSTNKSPP